MLSVPDDIREQRYEERGSNQNETWLNGRLTKVKNVSNAFSGNPLFDEPSLVEEYEHKNSEDTQSIINVIENYVNE